MDGFRLKHYVRRRGTDDVGKDYEMKMTALLALRCTTMEDTKDVCIASNAEFAGDFDDITILRQTLGGKREAFLMQLKHQENPENIKQSDFMYSSKNKAKASFSLAKYAVSVSNLNDDIAKDKSEVEFLRTFDNVHYVLFTNRGVAACDFLSEVQDAAFNFLNTSSGASVFKLNSKLGSDYDVAFLEQLVLFCDQVHVSKADDLIKEEVKKLMDSSSLGKISYSEAANQFLAFIKTWARTEVARMFHTLTKSDIISKLTEILLQPYKLDFSKDTFSFYDCARKLIWNDIAQKQKVTIVDSDDFSLNFLKEYVGSEIKKYRNETKNVWADDLSGKAVNLFYEQHKDLNTLLLKLSSTLNKTTSFDIYRCLCLNGKVPMLLSVDESQDYDDIIKIIKLRSCNIKIILIKSEVLQLKLKNTGHFVTFNDVQPDDLVRKILNSPVKLQGRSSVLLQDLIEKPMYKLLKCRDIIQILAGNFNIGYEYEPLFKYFINRSLSRVFLNPEVLHELKETFVIEDKCGFGKDFTGDNIILTRNSSQKQSEVVTNFHRLVYHDEDHLEWKQSCCNTKNLKTFVTDGDDEWEECVNIEKNADSGNTMHVISAAPGMGKTIVTDFIALNAPVDFWVLKIVFNRHKDYYDTILKQRSLKAQELLKFFNGAIFEYLHGTNIDLVNAVFEKFLAKKKVLVLLDGFDEIVAAHKDAVTEIINILKEEHYQTYITTRPSMTPYLEETCDTIASILKPFSVDDQRTFLNKYFSDLSEVQNDALTERFADELLQAAKRNLNDADSEFSGVPLQTLLLAEVFSEQFTSSLQKNAVIFDTHFDLVHLYKQFIAKKISILGDKFGSDAKYTYEKCLKLFALKLLFKRKYLHELNVDEQLSDYYEEEPARQLIQRDGIVVITSSTKFEFVHRTYAEFLAAQWLTENFNCKNQSIQKAVEIYLITYRFHDPFDQHVFLFKVFDSLLATNCPLHMAVINKNVEAARKLVKEQPETVDVQDNGGRTAMHLIALYGKKGIDYTRKGGNVPEVHDKFVAVLEDIPGDKFTNTKDYMSCSALDYAVFKHALSVAEKMCEKSGDLRVTTNANKYEIVFGMIIEQMKKCIVLNYKALFKALLVHTIYHDLIDNLIKQDLTIESYCRRRLALESYSNYHELFPVTTVSQLFQNGSQYNDLCLATVFGTEENINFLLSQGVDVNVQNIYLNSPLHYAVSHNRLEIAQLLMSKGAQINQQGKNGNTPVHYAAKRGYNDVLKLLVSHKANVNKQNDRGETPLLLAITHKHPHSAQLLLPKVTCIDSEDKQGNFPLYAAVSLNDSDIVSTLFDRGADIDKQNRNGFTALHRALQERNLEAAELLIKNGADCSLENNQAYTALIYAARNGSCSIAQRILESGADVNQKTQVGTALEMACLHSHLDLVAVLLSKGAQHNFHPLFLHFAVAKNDMETVDDFFKNNINVDAQNSSGKTPLMVALEKQRIDIATLLLAHGANARKQDYSGNSCLHYAARDGYVDLALELLNKGADIDHQNLNCETPAAVAVVAKHTNVAKLLLTRGADCAIEDLDGNVLLHHAALVGDDEIVSNLLSKDIDVDKQNYAGNTPLLVAFKAENFSAAQLLLQHADPTIGSFTKMSCLHYAAKAGYDSVITELLGKGLDIDSADTQGHTALDIAFLYKQVSAAKLLLSNGANITKFTLQCAVLAGDPVIVLDVLDKGAYIDAPDEDGGDTPLCWAIKSGNTEVAKLLTEKGANTTIRNSIGDVALHCAAAWGYHKLLPSLYENCVNVANNFGETPLHCCVKREAGDFVNREVVSAQVATVRFLLENGAQVNAQDKEGNAPLHYACPKIKVSGGNDGKFAKEFYQSVVKLLLDKGADVNLKNADNKSALDMC